jgi:hypothetical protein
MKKIIILIDLFHSNLCNFYKIVEGILRIPKIFKPLQKKKIKKQGEYLKKLVLVPRV